MSLRSKLEAIAPTDVEGQVDVAVRELGSALAVAVSLSKEDVLLATLVDAAAARHDKAPRLFVLETGRLHEETLAFLDRVRESLTLPIAIVTPDAADLEALFAAQGAMGMRASRAARLECCDVRKVRPLARALRGAAAWMTGLRRAHSEERATCAPVEDDARVPGLLKLSPLALFDDASLDELVTRHRSLVHPLHGAGFPSIGCAPCTRAVAIGEPMRAGRFWWEEDGHKECGLHLRRAAG